MLRVSLLVAVFLIGLPFSASTQPVSGDCHMAYRTNEKPGFGPTGRSEALLSVNNVRAALRNDGSLFYGYGGDGYQVGESTGRIGYFTYVLWIGGLVDGEIRASANDYGDGELWPGPLDEQATPADPTCRVYDRIWTISAGDLAAYDATGAGTDDLIDWPTGLGAPTVQLADRDGRDNDGDGLVDERWEGIPIDVMDLPLAQRKDRVIDLAAGERPDLAGDQMAWWITNDVAGQHYETQSAPMGIELHTTAYAHRVSGPLANTTFYRYRLFNRSDAAIDSVYLGFNSDATLGGEDQDDSIGADTTLGMGYYFNEDNFDEGVNGYGSAPPALGLAFIGQSWEPSAQQKNGLAALVQHSHTGGPYGHPRDAEDFYHYLTGRWDTGEPIYACGWGSPHGSGVHEWIANSDTVRTATIMYPGDPVTQQFWSQSNGFEGCSTADYLLGQRSGSGGMQYFIQSTGPFELAPGAEQEATLAVVWSRGVDHLNSITRLRADMSEVRSTYRAPRARPLPAAAPRLLAPAPGVTLAGGQPVPFMADVPDVYAITQIQLARDEGFTEEASLLDSRLIPLAPGRYFTRTRFVSGAQAGEWSETVAFDVSTDSLGYQDDLTDFKVVANAGGVLGQPSGAAAEFRGFPGLGRTRAAEQQATDAGGSDPSSQEHQTLWLIADDQPLSRTAGSFEHFQSRVTQYSGGFGNPDGGLSFVLPDDYEIRFTGSGKAWDYFSDAERVIDVPFELWNVGTVTPDDASDDFRLVPYVRDLNGNGRFDLTADDHSLSSGANDPYTDSIYWVSPADRTPGTQGYDAFIAAVETKLAAGEEPSNSCVGWADPLGGGVQVDANRLDPACNGVALMHRMVFVSYNGSVGDAADSVFYAPTLPETGTVFRILTRNTPGQAPILAGPQDGTRFNRSARLFWQIPDDAPSIRLQVATDDGFADLHVDAALPRRTTSAVLDTLDAGVYFWRVRVGYDGGNRLWSRTASFSVDGTSTADAPVESPQSLTLLSPAPHPVSGPSRLRFYLPQSSDVRMEAYDLMGRRVAVLSEGAQPQGWRDAAWPEGLSAGVYLVRLRAGAETQTRQVVVVR